MATYSDEPARPLALAPSCPLVLDALCVALLAKDPAKRPQTAEAVLRSFEDFLEGAKEREMRALEAHRLCELAKEPANRSRELDAFQHGRAEAARELLRRMKPWDSAETKSGAWALEDEADAAEREQATALARVIELYTKALGYDSASAEAHRGLAELYFHQAAKAEQRRNPAARIHYEALLAEHDDGRYAAALTAQATLVVESVPPGARVVARPYAPNQRVLVLGEPIELGVTPVRARLAAGSWLLEVTHPGLSDVRHPLMLRRGSHHATSVTMQTSSDIGEGFVFVPRSTVLLGGDAEAHDGLAAQETLVDDFAIARVPVTFREYCTFLDDLELHDPEQARRRAPHAIRGGEDSVCIRATEGWRPDPRLIEGEAGRRFPESEGHFWNVPVMFVDWYDARAAPRAHPSGWRRLPRREDAQANG